MNIRNVIIFSIMTITISTVGLAEDVSQVRVVTAEERTSCKYLGLISVRKSLGPNKQKGAFKKAFKEVEKLGGDSLYVVSVNLDWAEGAQVTGEALICKKSNEFPAIGK